MHVCNSSFKFLRGHNLRVQLSLPAFYVHVGAAIPVASTVCELVSTLYISTDFI